MTQQTSNTNVQGTEVNVLLPLKHEDTFTMLDNLVAKEGKFSSLSVKLFQISDTGTQNERANINLPVDIEKHTIGKFFGVLLDLIFEDIDYYKGLDAKLTSGKYPVFISISNDSMTWRSDYTRFGGQLHGDLLKKFKFNSSPASRNRWSKRIYKQFTRCFDFQRDITFYSLCVELTKKEELRRKFLSDRKSKESTNTQK